MAVEVIEKKKGGLTCGDCEADISKSASECAECGSKNIKKSLVVVRKSVGDPDDELETDETAEVEEDDDLEDDLDDDDDEDEDEDEDDDDEDDEDEDDEDDEDEDDDDEDETPVVEKRLVGLEALNISTALAEDIVKVFSAKKPSRKRYERTMTELNNVMDAASERWFAGKTVVAKSKTKTHVAAIEGRVNGIIRKEKTVARPKNLDVGKLPKEARDYIKSLEGGNEEDTVEKRYDGLPESVKKSLENADRIVEERETEKWLEVAKGYSHIPGNEVEDLAKSLRALSEADPKAFETLKKSLDAAEENLKTSEVFKSYGAPGAGTSKDGAKEEAITKAMEANEGWTREQAEVYVMDQNPSLVYKATA